ncbi:MAG: hypothetical protein V2B15_11355 [Bacteroidota bacterium]
MPETAGDKLTPVIFFSTENHSTEKKKFNFKLMFSESQYSSSEPQQYDYFVMQEPVFEEKIEEPVYLHVYEENGVLYCACTTSEGLYWYTYALNNPLIYTDPTGEKWWHWALAAMGLGIIPPGTVETIVATNIADASIAGTFGFVTGLSNRNGLQGGFDEASKRMNDSWNISKGLFQVDENLGGDFSQFIQVVSRFTWQNPQTSLGYSSSQIHGFLGGIKSVSYYGGATAIESYTNDYFGITLGSYIIGSDGLIADPNNSLFQHEFGHYLQSQTSGLFYLSKYGIPSATSKEGTAHSLHPTEQDANIRAFSYFNKYIPGYSGWDFSSGYGNPITGYNRRLGFNDPANQAVLDVGRLRLSWYDYLLGPNILLSGILDAIIQNHQY